MLSVARNTRGFTPGIWLGIFVIFLIAIAARVPFYANTSFALNDGGMFAQMVDDLRAHHFALPQETNYNSEHIPFCYPPLGFYFGALAQLVTGASTVSVLRWLPLLFNLAAVAVLYPIAMELLGSRVAALCAGMLYAVLPRSSEWLTMGGGLTRSPGELFAMLSVWFFARARNNRERNWVVAAGVAAGCAVLTHLEAGVLAAVSLCVLAVFTRPSRLQIGDLFVAGIVAVLVVAPWFIWMTFRHGISPFLAAFDTRGTVGSPIWQMLLFLVLAIVMWFLHQPPLAAWLLAVEIFVSRSAPSHTVIMVSLLVALFVTAGLTTLLPRIAEPASIALTTLLSISILAYYIPRHHFPNDRLRDLIFDTRTTLTSDNIAAMRWVGDHIPPDTRVFVFNQRIDEWFADLVGEWFPYLSRHQSIYTAQGREWLTGHAFQKAVDRIPACQNINSPEQLYAEVQPTNFDALFLTGPYDPDHARCAAFLRAVPGMHLALRLGQNEVYLRNR